jgi:hypothetical protein
VLNSSVAITAAFKAKELDSVATCRPLAFSNGVNTIVLISTPVSSPPVDRSVGRNNMNKFSINNDTTAKSPVEADAE